MGSQGGRRRFFSSLAAGAAASGVSGAAAAAASGRRNWLFDVTAFGAVGDDKTLTTAALQRAIDACVKAGGGVVLVPPGRYLTGSLFLGNNLELHLCAGATLVASQRFDDFPAIDGRYEGIERKIHAALLTGERLGNVSITGGGSIDGQGAPWWQAFEVTQKMRIARGLPREAPNPAGAPLRYPCPSIINLIRCERVRIEGIAFENSPLWNVNLVYCQDVVVDSVSMVGLHSPMSCGVYIDSCKRVRVTGSAIASGSDCIGLKAGYNEDGRRVGIPCEDVIISDCHLYDSFASGVAIGSETAAGIKNVTISNCVIANCRAAFYLRSTRGRGGGIERLRVSGCVAEGVRDSVIIVRPFWDSVRTLGYTTVPGPRNRIETDREARVPVNEGTPTFRDLDFSDISVGTTNALATIEGLPERFIQNLSIDRRQRHPRAARRLLQQRRRPAPRPPPPRPEKGTAGVGAQHRAAHRHGRRPGCEPLGGTAGRAGQRGRGQHRRLRRRAGAAAGERQQGRRHRRLPARRGHGRGVPASARPSLSLPLAKAKHSPTPGGTSASGVPLENLIF